MSSFVILPSKPNANLAYELIPGDKASNLLVVFLNGLGLAQGVWQPAIELFRQSDVSPKPWLLTYDRYGQGASAQDPRATWPTKDSGYAHTLDDVTDDLYELIQALCPDLHSRIVFVNNSIGAHVARRYADRYWSNALLLRLAVANNLRIRSRHPTVVEGILFLDSNPGNTDYESIWPNPKDPSFNLKTMAPPGTTLDVYEAAYVKMTTIFSPAAKNAEGFDRRDIKDILPDPSKPKLKGSKTSSDKGPWITVVGHELEQFSKQEWAMMKIPIGMAAMYTQP